MPWPTSTSLSTANAPSPIPAPGETCPRSRGRPRPPARGAGPGGPVRSRRAQCVVPGAARPPGPRAGSARGGPGAAGRGLELSLATHNTRNVTLCLTVFAQLAFVQGEGERAALLAGAAEGLRQRVGLQAWPLEREG